MSDKYPYASGSLLDERHTYFYSRYGGAAFLQAWLDDRLSADTANPAPAPQATGRPLPPLGAPVETAALLEALMAALQSDASIGDDANAWLRALVRKFEVTKRIHGAYDARFRAMDKADHRDLALYVRLAEVFERAYTVTGKLPFLNALLKIMDTLCAVRDGMSPEQRARLSTLVARERIAVTELGQRLEVAIGA